MRKRICFILSFWIASLTVMGVNVKTLGVKGDGITVDTDQIQAVIDQVSASGGGELVFPAGRYLTGTLVLRDNLTLRLEKGAVFVGSTNLNHYPKQSIGYVSHVNRYNNRALLFAEGAHNITITGEGSIDGQGTNEAFKADKEDPLYSIIDRPYIIRFISCTNVNVSGITLKNSPAWMQHYLNCESVRLENLTIFNHGNYNNDGVDIDNCRNVQITGCLVDTDDDGICIKSTNATGICENIVVSNCIVSSNCNAFKLGTETNGGFRNITVSNCAFNRPELPTIYDRPHRALGGMAISTVDGAFIEGVHITGITMQGVMTPLMIRLANRGRNYYEGGATQSPGSIRNILISNIIAYTVGTVPCSITGIPGHAVEDITLSQIRVITPGKGTLSPTPPADFPEMEKEYPETLLFIEAPAYGLYARHVKGLVLDNVRFKALETDEREKWWFEDVSGLEIYRSE